MDGPAILNYSLESIPQLFKDVLEKNGDKALVISKYILDVMQYNDEFQVVSWEYCSLRKWLNDDFYNCAFTDEEQQKICTSTIDNINDEVILLSEAGVNMYFLSDDDRICKKTEYASSRLANVNSWWLREPGYLPNYSKSVNRDGRVGNSIVTKTLGVRPAMWIKIN